MRYASKGNAVRLILDTNIVVSALLWGGIPRRLLELGRDNTVTLFTSPDLLDELADVLNREKFSKLLLQHQLTPDYLMQRYGMLAQVVNSVPIERTVPDDPDDDAVLACALAAHAQMIVTGDSDLIVLHPWQGIDIVSPAEALQRLAAGN